MPIEQKIAIVTGGSRGLGRNVVLALARMGVGSIFTYHSNRDEADAVLREIDTAGATGAALPLDVSETGRFSGFADQIRQALTEPGIEPRLTSSSTTRAPAISARLAR